jgi:protein TonB
MFEGNLIESRGLVVSQTQRWTALGSLTVQSAMAALLLMIPMLRPEMLPSISEAPRLAVPVPVRPPVVQQLARVANASSGAMSMPAAGPVVEATRRFVFPQADGRPDGPAPAFDPGLRMGNGDPGPLIALSTVIIGSGMPVVRAREAGPLHVSSGVTEGLLLRPIEPVYPAIAKAAGVQGTVVLEAVISKAGRIESLHAVSGPDMLKRAALDAVQAARYRPYLLNGEATEVQTTIRVVFVMRS